MRRLSQTKANILRYSASFRCGKALTLLAWERATSTQMSLRYTRKSLILVIEIWYLSCHLLCFSKLGEHASDG
jgi:hypothetical protein